MRTATSHGDDMRCSRRGKVQKYGLIIVVLDVGGGKLGLLTTLLATETSRNGFGAASDVFTSKPLDGTTRVVNTSSALDTCAKQPGREHGNHTWLRKQKCVEAKVSWNGVRDARHCKCCQLKHSFGRRLLYHTFLMFHSWFG